MGITATQLAAEMGLSKGRISQLVSKGVFDGCFTGEKRSRRFDLDKCKSAFQQRADIGQASGNGAATLERLESLAGGDAPKQPDRPAGSQADASASKNALARKNEALALKAETEARKAERIERLEEGRYVLASEVARDVQKLLSQEISKFDSVVRDMARLIADKNGLSYKEVRADMITAWREHRTDRAKDLGEIAAASELTEREKQEDL